MALSDLAFLSHGTASVSANYAMAWARDILYDARPQTFFADVEAAVIGKPGGKPFANAIVVDYTKDIKRIGADSVQIDQVGNLKGKPLTGALRGNEESLKFSYMTIATQRLRHAVGYEQYAQDKSFWEWRAVIRKLYSPWLARQMDKHVFDAAISGTTAGYNGTVASNASASTASMSVGGMTVTALSNTGVKMGALNAKPLTFSGGANGVQIPGYAAVLPPDQYADVMDETSMKSAFQLAWAPGADHPLRSGAMTRYKNLWIFQMNGDLWTGGSPLQPMCKLYTTVVATTTAATVYVSTSGSAACPTQYFPSSGYLMIYDPGGTKTERVHYTAKGDYYFTLTSSRASTTYTSWAAASTIVAYEVARSLFFGREQIARVTMADPTWIYEDQDYKERLGMGLRWISGHRKIDDTLDKTPGIQVINTCHDRTIEYI